MIHLASSLSLAVLETLAHVSPTEFGERKLLELEVPGGSLETVSEALFLQLLRDVPKGNRNCVCLPLHLHSSRGAQLLCPFFRGRFNGRQTVTSRPSRVRLGVLPHQYQVLRAVIYPAAGRPAYWWSRYPSGTALKSNLEPGHKAGCYLDVTSSTLEWLRYETT